MVMPADVAGVGPGAADGPPPLVDHHCHSVLRYEPDPGTFSSYLTESDRRPAAGTIFFDIQAGWATGVPGS
ncbi:hypothetical protein [Streptomyces sioyaensis]|uniref:hypothetical protein n=1 Tax=Streptomyces sioyaensis TaxID=67364 RepID=UPI0037131384